MFKRSVLNQHVADLLDAAEIRVRDTGGVARLQVDGGTIGAGPTVADAILQALAAAPAARRRAQALFAAAAFSFGPDYVFEAIDMLWGGEDDEDEEDDEDDEDEDEEDDAADEDDAEVIRFQRR